MKLSTALFASILSICLTAGYVSGQIQFADGTTQTTAYEGRGAAAAPAGSSFNYGHWSDGWLAQTNQGWQITNAVPAGQELVILDYQNSLGLISRLPGGDKYTDSKFVMAFQDKFARPYPNGVVVVDEGRELWLDHLTNLDAPTTTINIADPYILGYYRNK